MSFSGKKRGRSSQGGESKRSKKSAREEIDKLMDTVKQYASKALEGRQRTEHEADKLTKLGAPPPKQQKVPYKMKLGLLAAKKKRDFKQAAEARESQVTMAGTPSGNKGKGKKRR
ncbi:hypothetical protein B484DRAFT_445805 [Ochromonadaceae sp. CCMP2298]|nr:hypothetical protein B484DRAFT_400514 [Ochromonadaceae sp. CCMP2298]KAJ1436113.1 hypothetical protein B484DRAFT_445805 [Ochromonadaceae sp. CCMP2298]|mmetsp:Transcript_9645/g.21111  ORF Transcript_9645/g.21111 Transcript_9645/m.21111 type:complete len:115 (-) Transcript_9645:337-681(-)